MPRKFVMIMFVSTIFEMILTEKITDSHPDTYLSITQLAEKYGYPMETHEITTDDGYILKMYRIPHGRRGSGVNKKPLLMVHGLYGQGENYVVSARHNASLAFMGADDDYDVWLANCRGTQHGRKHVSLDVNQTEFWNFSFHQIAVHDIPAMIDHILETTKKQKINYVGHSQGGAVFYILCSEKPEYQKKIAMASLLSPAGFLFHLSFKPVINLANHRREFLRFTKKYSLHEFPPGTILPDLLTSMCVNSTFGSLCESILEEFAGSRSGELDLNMIALLIRFVPNVAANQLLHFTQIIASGHFRQWDYGSEAENLRAYGTKAPPDYKIEQIHVPVAIYSSYADNLVDYRDTQFMCKKLPKCLKHVIMKNPLWSHVDFIFSKNAAKQLNKPLLRYMDKFN